MGEKGQVAGIAADSPIVLYHQRSALLDRVAQFTGPVMPVNAAADRGARFGVGSRGSPDWIAGDFT